MRKLIVLCLIVLLVVVGCGDKEATVAPPPETTESQQVYYFLASNMKDAFYIPSIKGFTQAGVDLGIKTEIAGPMEYSLSELLKTFEALVAKPTTAGIYFVGMDVLSGEPMIKAAQAKGIPVVVGMADTQGRARDAFIGYDNVMLGNAAGEWIAELTDCKGVVGAIGNPGATVIIRTDAMLAYLAERCPDIKTVPFVSAEPTMASGVATLEAYLVANPDMTLFWYADGVSGLLAPYWEDRQELGSEVMFLATDMPPAALQAVKDGVFVGTVGQDTYSEEYFGLQILYHASQGKRVPDSSFMAPILVDKLNVDQFIE